MVAVSTPPKPPLRPVTAPASIQQKESTPSDDQMARIAFSRLKKRVVSRTWIIVSLTAFVAILLPFAKPIDIYYAITPEQKVRTLTGLTMPNMTNSAVLSWATTSITEVMTMGFGDIDRRVPLVKGRFTEKGWEAYVTTFNAMKISESFKQNQLILTTVPSNTPVIVGQGVNEEDVYQWNVQMPIIMNYATNNNVTRRQRATVSLSIVRVPFEENSFGIAIRNWRID